MTIEHKIDLKKELRHLYNPKRDNFTLVDVPPLSYLMIDGRGDPNTAAEYVAAIEALYAVAYGLKFMSKRQQQIDYVVMPLEGLWWADDMSVFQATPDDRSDWQWTAMILQPDHITEAMIEQATQEAGKKKDLPALPKMRYEELGEGLSVQIMHIGPYAEEAPTLRRLHEEYLPANHMVEAGKHHEIYLSDPRRTAPSKLKTVLRQPVKMK